MTAEQMALVQDGLGVFLKRFRPCFKQGRTFSHLERYLTGLLSDTPRKSIEPIALAAGTCARTLQAFLSSFAWDHAKAHAMLQRMVAEEHAALEAIGVIDASAHAKRGDKSPGVHRQYCGETGKIDNCIVGQHLLYTDDHPKNPFCCMLATDLYLPQDWHQDPERCREAGIPEYLPFRPKWQIAIDQLKEAIGNGVKFSWVTFDEDYGNLSRFWLALDALGIWGAGEVKPNFWAWAREPGCRSGQAAHRAKRVDNLACYSPVFTRQKWKKITVKTVTRGKIHLLVKHAQIYLVKESAPDCHGPSIPTERRYWLVVAKNLLTGVTRYIVSNAPGYVTPKRIVQVVFARWHVEKWFERSKQEAGLGAFEVRTYTSLIRHWLICRIAMMFLACQTRRLRKKKSENHLRTGGTGGQRRGLGPVESEPPLPPRTDAAMCLLPAA